MKYTVALFNLAIAVRDDRLQLPALTGMIGLDDLKLSIATSSPTAESVEALAALTDEQRWDIVTYCLIEEASCADLPEWETAIEEACGGDDAPAACAIVAEFFEEVEKIFSEDETAQTASSYDEDQDS